MKSCDLCGDVEIVFENGDVAFCVKHSIEMNATPNRCDKSDCEYIEETSCKLSSSERADCCPKLIHKGK